MNMYLLYATVNIHLLWPSEHHMVTENLTNIG